MLCGIVVRLFPNGSGKTTWMKMVAGLVKPTNGEILYQGTPIGKESKKEAGKEVQLRVK